MIVGEDVKHTAEEWAEIAERLRAAPDLIRGKRGEWQKLGSHRYRISADRKSVEVMFGYDEGARD